MISGPLLEGERRDGLLWECPFCNAGMVRYENAPDASYHPLDQGCILDGFGVPNAKRDLWNCRPRELANAS